MSVIPYRLVLIQTCCAYTGILHDDSICGVLLPYDHLTGILCSSKYVCQAKSDCYYYCELNDIYPITEKFVDLFKSKFEKDTVQVKRSSGVIEDGWMINPRTSTSLIGGTCSVHVRHSKGLIDKYVSIDELCELNGLVRADIMLMLETELDEWYNGVV